MSNSCKPGPSSGCALTLLLLDAARSVEAQAERALGEVGLSLAKLGALRHLVLAQRPLRLTELAERHCCGRSNVTALVGRLEAEGMVSRVEDTEDRRQVLATVTPAGLAAYQRASVLLAEHERGLEARLGKSARAELAGWLRGLSAGSQLDPG